MNDTIIIEDLEVSYHVGVPAAERENPQRLLLSIRMETDFKRAAASDDIAGTIDYFAVTRSLLRFGDGRSWKLIEKLAVDLADHVLREFKPRRVQVGIKKFILPETRFVGVEIVRPQS